MMKSGEAVGVVLEGSDAAVAAGQFPHFVGHEEVELAGHRREVRRWRAEQAPQGAVQVAEAEVVEMVVVRVGGRFERGFGAAVAGKGAAPEALVVGRRPDRRCADRFANVP
jgi:hypothetical protein